MCIATPSHSTSPRPPLYMCIIKYYVESHRTTAALPSRPLAGKRAADTRVKLRRLIRRLLLVMLAFFSHTPQIRSEVSIEELNHILTEVNAHIIPSRDDLSPIRTIAGGSVANTIQGLSAGFGISTGIIGACGDDDQGLLFVNNMSFSGVDLTRLRAKKGHTAQVV